MEINEYWFSLKSHIYVDFKSEKVLLYDTKKGNYKDVISEEAINLISQLYKAENLGVVKIDEKMQLKTGIMTFVDEVVSQQMGDLMEVKENMPTPIQLIPILNLQKDIDKLKKVNENIELLGENILKYLLEINLYVNNVCNNSCTYCKDYCKQFNCCTAGSDLQELPIEYVELIFKQIKYSNVRKINLSGGNILLYSNLNKIRNIVGFSKNIHIYLHYNLYEKNDFLDIVNLELIVNFPLNKDAFNNAFSLANKEQTTFHLIIENEEQYLNAEKLINEFDITKYSINPFYTGENIDFFKKNIFLDKDDIFSNTLSMREIFRNKKLNSNYFGTLHILPDGTVKTNMNCKSLGNIKSKSILDLILKEMLDNTGWRVVRDQKPCSDCTYQWICPPISNYELAIGKTSLCHLRK